MNRIPKDLLARLDYFHREVEELFSRLFGSDFGSGFSHDDTLPCLDLLETEDEVILRADLPGVAKESIDLHVAPNYVVLRGAKEAPETRHDCLRVERTFGSFQRLMPLPATADVGNATARLERGVLEVRMPKLVDRRKGQRRIRISE
jgi:HSP20 family protein